MELLITNEQRIKMIQNGMESQKGYSGNHWPVVKLFTPDACCTWLLSELDPEDPDIAFGLCDLGLGLLQLGYVSISEIASIRGRLGFPVERNPYFMARKSLLDYFNDAQRIGRITDSVEDEDTTKYPQITEDSINIADNILGYCGDLVNFSEELCYELKQFGLPTHGLTSEQCQTQADSSYTKAEQDAHAMNPAEIIGTIKALAEVLYHRLK